MVSTNRKLDKYIDGKGKHITGVRKIVKEEKRKGDKGSESIIRKGNNYINSFKTAAKANLNMVKQKHKARGK